MKNVRKITYDYVKWRQDHTALTKRKFLFLSKGEKLIYNELYHMRSFLHPMMTDIKRNLI
jgi:hypothetical protein